MGNPTVNDTTEHPATPVHVIGIGMDGIQGLHPNVQALIQKATLLVGSDRHLRYISNHPAPKIALGSLRSALDAVQQHLQQQTDAPNPLVIILASGDPLFFGIGRLVMETFPRDIVTIHPHLSALQLAFSRVKIPWQDAHIISVHGRSLQPLQEALENSVDKIAVLTDPDNSPGAIARLLLALDRPHRYHLWVCENLGGDNERVRSFNPKALAATASEDFGALNVVILLRQHDGLAAGIDLPTLPVIGIPDSYFASFGDRPGLMTKREIRLMILGELALKPQAVLWDIGAGTGSVSIEAARICPHSTIYAIEKTAAGIALIQANRQRFQTDAVHPIQGTAPDCLAPLPRPTHVFIGGSGGHLIPVLTHCLTQLIPNGTLVIALATLERLSDAIAWVNRNDVKPHLTDYRLVACQIARSLPVGTLTRLTPLNPVHLLTLTKTRHSL